MRLTLRGSGVRLVRDSGSGLGRQYGGPQWLQLCSASGGAGLEERSVEEERYDGPLSRQLAFGGLLGIESTWRCFTHTVGD